MAMSWIWTVLVTISLVYGSAAGTLDKVSAAAMEGAEAAVKLCLSMAGTSALWCGIMEVMSRSGIASGITRLLRPVLHRLFPAAGAAALEAISENVAANLLGLGNAATPAGVRAAQHLHDGTDMASSGLCTLVVINTASIQLLPVTVAAVRAAAGSAAPFDILPAVWVTSAAALAAGLSAAKLFSRLSKEKEGRRLSS